jgi:hypothetical protein
MTLLFLTQKSGAVYQAKLGKPIIIGRSNPIDQTFLIGCSSGVSSIGMMKRMNYSRGEYGMGRRKDFYHVT